MRPPTKPIWPTTTTLCASAAEYARTHYPTSQILPKFLFIDALTYATQGDAGEFRSRLKHLVETYPQADMAPLAAGWLRESLKGRKINSSGTNVRGMIWPRGSPTTQPCSPPPPTA